MKNLTKLIYLASPYSFNKRCTECENNSICFQCTRRKKSHEKYRYKQITKVAARLQDKFPYAFILPITMSHNTGKYMRTKDGGFETWEIIDYTYISKCDELWAVTMNGWSESIGVTKEIEFAKKNNITIKYYDPVLDSFTIDSHVK